MKKLIFAMALVASCESAEEKRIHHETDSIIKASDKIKADAENELRTMESNYIDSCYKIKHGSTKK